MSLPVLFFVWLAAAPAIVLTILPPAAPTATHSDETMHTVVATMRARIDAGTDVIVDTIHEVSLPDSTLTDAVPTPETTLNGTVRFVLHKPNSTANDPARMTPLKHATVTLRVVTDHVHTARPMRHDAVLAADDVVPARHVFETDPLTHPPTVDDALHNRVLRDLPADACLTRQAFTEMSAVQTETDVVTIVRIDGIETQTNLMSVDSGNPDDTVQVTNPENRRTFRTQIINHDLVKIRHE